MEGYNTLKNVSNGEYFKIDFFNLDEKDIEHLKNIMINEGDIIRVIKHVEELDNDAIIVATKDGQLVTIFGNYLDNCYGFIVEPKIINFNDRIKSKRK